MINRRSRGGRMPEDIAALRAATDRQMMPRWLPRLPLAEVRDQAIPGPCGSLPVRLFRPRGAVTGLVVFFHGGGFVHCGLESHDGICCRLARASRALVMSVAYRLAPEHRFPAATEDACAALLWATQNAPDPRRVALAGDSAGANLAAVAALLARDRGLQRPAFQLLYYPTTHGIREVSSRCQFADGYFLTRQLMRWYLDQYIDAEHHWTSPYFAPFLAPDLDALPPAMIFTAECDPLRDEGAAYAERLAEAGVSVTYRCVPGTIHAFLNFYPVQAKSRRAIAEGGAAIRAAFAAAS